MPVISLPVLGAVVPETVPVTNSGEPMSTVLYEKDGRIARITLNRPERMNAIDDDMPPAIEEAVKRAESGSYDWTDDKPIK